MAGFDKRVASYEEALAGLEDGMTVLAGGFGLCGIPENLIAEIKRKGTRDLTVVSNNCGVDGFGLGVLLEEKQIRKVIASMPPDAPLERVIPAMIESSVEDWSTNRGARALQGIFVLNPVLYAEYSQSSQDVAEALRPFMAVWNIKGSFADWQRMHSVFGDCAIVLFDRAVKAEPAEQVRLIAELKALAVAYFKTAVTPS